MAIAMGWHKPDNVAGSSAPAIMVGLFVATGGLLFGYDTGYARPAFFQSEAFWEEWRTESSHADIRDSLRLGRSTGFSL